MHLCLLICGSGASALCTNALLTHARERSAFVHVLVGLPPAAAAAAESSADELLSSLTPMGSGGMASGGKGQQQQSQQVCMCTGQVASGILTCS